MADLTIHYMDTPGKKAQGLQHMKPIPDKTIWSFLDIREGQIFHSQNVHEPFEIAFLDRNGKVLTLSTVVPQAAVIAAPRGAAIAVEAKDGELSRIGFVVGTLVSVDYLYPTK